MSIYIYKLILKPNILLISLIFFKSLALFSQVPLTATTNTLCHGDILCKIVVSFMEQDEKGSAAVWHLPAIIDGGKEHLQLGTRPITSGIWS